VLFPTTPLPGEGEPPASRLRPTSKQQAVAKLESFAMALIRLEVAGNAFMEVRATT